MKTIKTKVYQFDELSEEAREKALQEMWSINVDYDWYEFVYEDAKQIGLQIEAFDIDRGSYCEGKLIVSMEESIEAIFANHGKDCDTYILATEYKNELKALGRKYQQRGVNESQLFDYEQEVDDLTSTYRNALCEEYLSMLKKEYEYQTSEEAIRDTIEANEYDFLENGKRY